jgi:tRNA-splicing ligase RtcB
MPVGFHKVDDYRYSAYDMSRMNVPAEVFASDAIMEASKRDSSLNQLLNITSLPGIVGRAIAMPDIHQGYGFPIGGVALFDFDEGLVSPGGVGYDINCGVILIRTGLDAKDVSPYVKELVDSLFREIPVGFNKAGLRNVSRHDIEQICLSGVKWSIDKGYINEEDSLKMEDRGSLLVESTSTISEEAKARGLNQLLSIGSGNHFIEIQRVDKILDNSAASKLGIFEGEVMVMAHTGSRGLGHQVATDYLKALSERPEGTIMHPEDSQLISAHIKSRIAHDYMEAMNSAANFAFANRSLILWKVRQIISQVLRTASDDPSIQLVYALSHNMAKVEDHLIDGKLQKVIIHRKGATRAFSSENPSLEGIFKAIGQPVIVPGDMGTASYLLTASKGNDAVSFESSCHGAGRTMSRHQSASRFSYAEVSGNLLAMGIRVRSATRKGLVEEAPGSYKDIEDVIEVTSKSQISKPTCKLKPLGVIKG